MVKDSWLSPLVIVKPKYSPAESKYLKLNSATDSSAGSGVLISECHLLTPMHVAFQPWDLLSFGREGERQIRVLGQHSSGERVVTEGRLVLSSPFWIGKTKEEVQQRQRAFANYYKLHEDVALFKLSPVIKQDKQGVYRKLHLGELLGWYVPAWDPPTAREQEFMIAGGNTEPYLGHQLTTELPFKAYIDRSCQANWLESEGAVIFRGTCHLTSGMSGGPLVLKSSPRKLYGLAQGAVLKYDGAPPKRQPELFNRRKLNDLYLNQYLAVWPHRERLLKAMKEYPCER